MSENEHFNSSRIAKIIETILRVAAGDYSVQAELSGKNDDIDSLALGINMMIDDLKTSTVRHEYIDNRVDEILDTVRGVARGDFSGSCKMSEKNDNFDALGSGLNMMIDDVRDSHNALKESEEKFKAQYKGIPVPTYTWQWNKTANDFVLIDYNDAARDITGGHVIDFIGKSARDMYAGRPDILNDLSHCFREKEVVKREMTLQFSKNTETKHLNVTYVFVPPDLIMVHTEDITDRKRAEAEILFKNALLETQFEASIDGILAYDNNEKIISYNNRFLQLWRIPDDLMNHRDVLPIRRYVLPQLINPGEFVNKIAYLNAHKMEKSRDEILFKDGRIFERHSVPLISAAGEHFGRIWFFRDVTEMKTMQEKIVSQEKLAVLGQLAGGIGHELRNPLGAIKNAVYFLNMILEKIDPEIGETLQILDREVINSERILNSLLDFARARPPIKRRVEIHDVILESLSCINVPENINVKNRVSEKIPVIIADRYQLEQVFGNILNNAVQAMPEGGQLEIIPESSAPGWLAISVTDSGSGIPEENLPKIFTPLFTGKAKGIGLGLAISKTFVEGHGGSIDVKSKEGRGTTVLIKLPTGISGHSVSRGERSGLS